MSKQGIKFNMAAAEPIGMQEGVRKYGWLVTAVLGFGLFLGIHLYFVFVGRVNADEGWYLYASKLVYRGLRPYQDFAFTQTPFLPYVYGLPQLLFTGGIYVGRATSVVLSALGLLLSYLGARRYAGEAAGAIAVLLGATFVFGIYFQTISKTYALTTFLFSATFFLLSSQEGGRRKWVGGTVVVLLAAFTRLSAVLFALPLVVYAFLKADRRGKIMIAAVIFGAIVMAALLVMPNVEAAMWNLIIHHAAQWGDLSLSERVVVVVRDRSEALYRVFPSYIGLVGAMVVFGLKPMVRYVWGRPILLATILGLLLFSLPNLMSGAFHAEYFTPFIFGFIPILAVVFVEIKQRVGLFSRIGLYLVLIGALGLALFRGGWAFVDRTGGRLPVEEIREVADFVVENSTPEDQVFAMEGLWVVVEAERDTPPNMTMAQFSFYRGPVEEAADFKLINEFVTLDYFRAGIPKLVILTDFDWRILMNSEDFELVQAALTEGYELKMERGEWGQFHGGVQVYERREVSP